MNSEVPTVFKKKKKKPPQLKTFLKAFIKGIWNHLLLTSFIASKWNVTMFHKIQPNSPLSKYLIHWGDKNTFKSKYKHLLVYPQVYISFFITMDSNVHNKISWEQLFQTGLSTLNGGRVGWLQKGNVGLRVTSETWKFSPVTFI